MYPVSLCLFLCVKKKTDVREGAGETKTHHEVYFEERTFTSVPNRMDVHGHAHPKLPRRTMLNPLRAQGRVQLFQQCEVN